MATLTKRPRGLPADLDVEKFMQAAAEEEGMIVSAGFPPGFLDGYWGEVRRKLGDTGLPPEAIQPLIDAYTAARGLDWWRIFERPWAEVADDIRRSFPTGTAVMSKAKPAVPDPAQPPSDDALAALMADTSAFDRATAKSKIGKAVGSVVVAATRGKSRQLAVASDAGPMTARKAAAAGFTRITIVYNGPVNGRPEWELTDEVRHADPVLGCTLIAPKGYKFDLASVPRPLWAIIAPFDLSTLAPLFHDLIYEFKGNLPSADYVHPHPARRFTQKEADDLFLRLMAAEGVPWWKRNAAYSAVRAAGWSYWNT